jgi:hypothetical protein
MATPRAFDAAYVGRIEEERGILTVEEHARLVVAAERGARRRRWTRWACPEGR